MISILFLNLMILLQKMQSNMEMMIEYKKELIIEILCVLNCFKIFA